jgi:osmotically-inducible protein OsmY
MDTCEKAVYRTVQIAVASVIALNLAACDQEPSAEKVGRDIDRAVEKAGQRMNQAANAVEKKIELAKDAAGNTATEAGKAIDDGPGRQGQIRLDRRTRYKALAGVAATDGVVTLRGTAGTPENRDKAAQVALNVPGVKLVKNNINIVEGT